MFTRRRSENCVANSNQLLAGVIVCIVLWCTISVKAITNTQEQQQQQVSPSQLPTPQQFTQLQYPPFTDQLSRGQLSPQEQSHILSDVQQHRFLVNVGNGPRQEQAKPQTSYTQQPIKIGQHSPQQNHHHHQQQQPSALFPPQQTFHHQFPQEIFQIGNLASTFVNSYHADKKPILLQPTYPQDYKQAQSQKSQQQTFHPSNTQQSFQPVYQQAQQTFQQPKHTFAQPTYQQNFQPPPSPASQYDTKNNYVVSRTENKPPKHQQYLTEVPQPKAFPSDTYTPDPLKYPTQSWVLETQPPTPYKKQKPYDAITFATESYKPATQTPRVKYRPRPMKQEEKYTTNKEEQSDFYIKTDRKKLYEQLVDGRTKSQHVTTPRSVTPKVPRRSSTVTTASPTPPSITTKPPVPDEHYIQQQLQKQIQEQLYNKDDLFGTLKITLPGELNSDQIANLPNLALGDSIAQVPDIPPQLSSLSELPQSVFLANGQNVKLSSSTGKPPRKGSTQVKTIVVKQPTVITTTTTIKPPTVLFEELTKNVLPPGADFELIRQKQDGALEEVGNIQNFQQKKVTFVILEEQLDGTVKVQGVRGNENLQSNSKEAEVESIIDRLKKGEIKLPPSTKLFNAGRATPQESQASPNYVKHENKVSVKPTIAPKRRPSTTRSPTYSHSTLMANTHAGPIYQTEDYNTKRSTTTTTAPRNRSEYTVPIKINGPSSFLPTVTSSQNVNNSINIPYSPQPTSQNSQPNYNYSPSATFTLSSYTPPPAISTQTQQTTISTPFARNHATGHIVEHVTTPVIPALSSQTSSSTASATLTEKLRNSGLFAMAKFLRQSGLDTVLNETGPCTLFVPTDKAFRALLVQLGGPDRAELKFKENPRLLSGLLLHHVIPGAFKAASLQDEMTGVSLAGTQLRVNTYTTQDQEWNDVRVVTINGARILGEKSDIMIPQGVAHTIDRVMFPLPVGDVLQTLMSDRENRFSKFVKLLQDTGVAQSLQVGRWCW